MAGSKVFAKGKKSSKSSSGKSEKKTSEHVNVEQDGSRKRRRLSPFGSDLESAFESDETTSPALPRSTPTTFTPASTVSRIKPKQKMATTAQPDGEVSDSIQEAMKGTKSKDFASLNVDPWLVTSLANLAIKHPTGIQSGCIPEILKGRDCIGGSRTGSGKTAAFAVPILQIWARDPSGIFALILTPTRYVRGLLFLYYALSLTRSFL